MASASPNQWAQFHGFGPNSITKIASPAAHNCTSKKIENFESELITASLYDRHQETKAFAKYTLHFFACSQTKE